MRFRKGLHIFLTSLPPFAYGPLEGEEGQVDKSKNYLLLANHSYTILGNVYFKGVNIVFNDCFKFVKKL